METQQVQHITDILAEKKRVGQRTFFSVLHERINMSLPCKNGQVAGLLLFHTNKRQTDVHPAYGGLVNVPYIRYMGEFFYLNMN